MLIEHFDEIDSTNTYLMNQPQTGDIRVVIAEAQTGGRGQNGRAWHSPKGENIYLSMRLPFGKSAQQIQGLSLAIGVSLLKTLEPLGIQDLKLKWPNDLLWQGKKLAGILVETTQIQENSCWVVIGVGLNVNMDAHDHIDQPWTSLRLITGQEWNREPLIDSILENILQDFKLFEEKGYEAFHETFLKYEL